MKPRIPDHITEKEWIEDFRDFVSSGGAPVPESLSKKVLQHVHRDLNPPSGLVFLKLLGIHATVGTLSLSVCDQFGMSPFNSGISLSEYFMRFGHSACMFLCGFLFLSLTVFFSSLALRSEEFRVIKKTAWMQIPFLALLSIAVFLGLGDGMAFSVATYWLVGAISGGLISTYLRPKLSFAH